MEYYQKYIKYKNKYLELKNQYGGIGLNLYLPSDIYNITKNFMIEVNDYKTLFKNKLGDTDFNKIYHYILDSNQTFVQDPSIIFNQKDQQDKKYIIRLSKYDYKNKEFSDVIFNDDFNSSTDLLLGGNFISIPPNPHNNLSLIITTKCLNDTDNSELDKLINFIKENIIETQQIIKINCSFPHLSGGIHIDELLCPMPYKSYELFSGYEMNYKIWIYKINSIDFDEENIKEIIKNIGKNLNHTRFDGYTKEDLQNIIKQIEGINTEINKFSFGNPKRKELKEESKIKDKNGDIISFKELNKEEYKILYKLIRENKYEQVKKLYEDLQDIELFRTNLLEKFNNELEENKRIIGSSIFGDLYEENKVQINNNFFVEYPIDLKFKYNNFNVGYSIILPPIFNRVFIKLEEKNICFIPVKNKPEQLLLDFIQKEHIDMIPIEFEYIDTYKYHIKGGDNADGGNIHCLSKQIFI